MTSFRPLAIATAAATALQIAWGGVVRATGSGDGCPDWPRCYGSWIPRWEYHTIIEYLHRFLGMTAGLLSLALAIVGIVALVRGRRGRATGVPGVAAWMAVALAPMFLAQGILGGAVVATQGDPSGPAVLTVHFAAAFVVLGIAVAIATIVSLPRGTGPAERPRGVVGYARTAAWGALLTFALLLVGTYVRAEGAGLAFRDWPLMDQRLIPSFDQTGAAEMFAHRLLALTVFAWVLWLMVRARTMTPRVRLLVLLSTLTFGLLVAQILVGAFNVWTALGTVPRASHVGMSALVWSSIVALAVAARRIPTPVVDGGGDRAAVGGARALEPLPETQTPSGTGVATTSTRDRLHAYLMLTKPRIIVLLLITTVPAMILAAGGIPPLWLILATLVGGSLAAGSANAINMYLDRDIDQVMKRTRQRPLPAHAVTPEDALRFGFVLGAISFAFLAAVVNVLAASLALAAIAFYVFVYTMWLKRSTAQNIVIGGAAGAAPALVGWAAVTGTLAWPAWVLFAIVFVWTPPHFWALAMRYQGDYAAAGVPMLPVVKGEDETRRQIFLYSLVLFGTTLLLVPLASMGLVYLLTAVVLGGIFVYRALLLWRRPDPDKAWRLFTFSIAYLAALFGAVALDALVVARIA
jgi:protoheme IX farnesyltransferase